MRLGQICNIQLGLTPRGKLEPSDIGGIPAIQLRDIGAGGRIDLANLARLDLAQPDDRYFVRTGDIIFRSRGAYNTATPIIEPLAAPVLAILPLFILRPTSADADPQYIAWAINRAPAQTHLDREAQGQTVRMISKASLDDLSIDLPPLSIQRQILEIADLVALEKDLSEQLIENRRKLWERLLTDKAKAASLKGNRP